jgi:altronate dehydratase
VNAYQREPSPISLLRLGLQCGGSDAFSGVSANPLVGILSREIVAHGGSANLAETDELIGAESYVLSNVRNLETAEAFLERLDRFQQWAREHGHSAEGNPSGGNNFRGLYNIAIKSIGAARKKDPATRLDYVIQFAERMTAPGFYFMDSPGNDLESIAGQVAAGCNMILFATGNGSITNFPFVPTIKIMTTSRRFELVRNEMDFNAGRYQDGEPLEDLGREAFSQMLDIASGRQSAGEKAGHSQVQLWREWRGHGESRPGSKETADPRPSTEFQSEHLEIAREITRAERLLRVALVLPTSLCSGQIALAIAERLNQIPQGKRDFSHAVALPHTEGCGNSGGESERLFLRTMAGYLMHPFVSKALLLEHGCEKTHNDAFRNVLRDLQMPESRYGFGSIQLDGGIDRVAAKSIEWFLRHESAPNHGQPFTLALHGRDMPPALSAEFEKVKNALLAAGAAVVTSSEIGGGRPILYGEHIASPALYAMECPTDDDLEIVTGLAATGAEIIVVYQPDFRLPSNPLVPTIQLGPGPDADVTVAEDSRDLAASILSMVLAVRQGRTKTSAETIQNVAFQMTRGLEGISL